MKIIHIITSINRGGAENHLCKLIERQVKSGKTVKLIYLKGDGYWQETLKHLGVDVINLALGNYAQIWKIKDIVNVIDSFCPHILHLHMPPAELYGFIALRLCKNKPTLIITKHNDERFARIVGSNFICKFIYLKAAGVIHISTAVQNYFDKLNLKSKPTQRVIRYGIDVRDFEVGNNFNRTEFLAGFNIPEGPLLFCSICRLVEQKQVDVLLLGFAEFLRKHQISSHLIIVGSGVLENRLKSLAINLGIEEKITWVSFTDQIKELLSSVDIFVLCSKYEGLGLVLLEAMASKLPIIASQVSAIPELIKDDLNGFLFKSGDAKMLAEKMFELTSKDKRVQCGINGFNIVSKEFDNDKMEFEISDFYKILCNF